MLTVRRFLMTQTNLQNGFLKNETVRIISARLEFDTQHIALVGNDSPICGSKIMQANEIPLKLGYLCERCARKYTRLTKRALDGATGWHKMDDGSMGSFDWMGDEQSSPRK